jgi:apolipoprotein N-acyltransferase
VFWIQAILVLISGAALSAAMPPIGLWFCFLALVPLFIVVANAERAGASFWFGFYFALGFFALHLFWLPNSLSKLFGAFIWATFPPMVLILGCFWGVVTYFSRLIGRRGFGTLLLLPAFWLLMEWARTHGPFAFPWGSLGYLWLGTPIAQASDLAGSYGLSLLTLVVSALLAAPFMPTEERSVTFGSQRRRGRAWFGIPVALLLLAVVAVYGLFRLELPLPTLDRIVLLVQGNTDPLGRAQGLTDDVTVYTDLTRNAMTTLPSPPSLVVWPEGAVIGEATLEGDGGEALRQRLQASTGNATLITGMSLWEQQSDGNYFGYNRVYGLAEAVATDKYDKIGLVPFGERLPFFNVLRPVYTLIYPLFGLGAYTRVPGAFPKPITTPELTAAVYICYESVFPHIVREQVKRGGQVLVNITNDAWFGSGNGAEQHFLMGTMRAIETKRYLLRAGNDGVTAVVDPHGQVLERLERHISSSLVGEYALMDGQTLYVRWGDWIIWVVATYAVIVVIGRVFSSR